MSDGKTSICRAKSYAGLGEFWDSHDLGDYWDRTEPADFDVDVQNS